MKKRKNISLFFVPAPLPVPVYSNKSIKPYFPIVNIKKILSLLLILLISQSCSLEPQYESPCVEMPDHWRIPSDEGSTLANLEWWKQFNDPILDCLIKEALLYNNDLQVAISRVCEYYSRYLIVRSQLYPQIDGVLSFSREEFSIASDPPLLPGTDRFFDTFLALLTLNYEVDFWGRLRNQSAASYSEYLAQEETKRTVILTLVGAVANSYISLRQYDKQLWIAQETLQSRIKSWKLAVFRFEGGQTSELEAKQAESLVQAAEVEVVRFNTLINEEENLLSVLVGRVPDAVERGLWIDDFGMPPCVPTGIPSDLLRQRPDIRQAEDLLIASNDRIGVARADFFPQVVLSGNYGSESARFNQLFKNISQTWDYAVTLTQPLYTGGRLSAQLELAFAENRQFFYQYQQAVLQALKEVDDALVAHQDSLELIKILQDRVRVLTDYLNLATLQYNNGQTDYLNVLDAERTKFAAELDLAEEQGNSFRTLVDIYKALAGGWVIEAEEVSSQ